MSTENIKFYLAFAYSDEQLAALLAHAESGKLAYCSCCCLVGIPTAPHALADAFPWLELPTNTHLVDARKLPFATLAELEYYHLGSTDELRRERIIPIIKAEMERREKAQVEDEEFTDEPSWLSTGIGK